MPELPTAAVEAAPITDPTEPKGPAPKLPDAVFVTVSFGPPTKPVAAAVWHAVHWNKAAEMMRPYGWQEVERVHLGKGRGSYMTFGGPGFLEPKLPQEVQDWLEATQPNAWKIGVQIAKAAAGFLKAVAALFGCKTLAEIGKVVGDVTNAVEDAVEDAVDPA